MLTTITVTQQHITNGIARDCKLCPIALAVTELLIASASVTTVGYAVFVRHDYKQYAMGLPDRAQAFITVFDAPGRGLAWPFSFDLEIPKCLLRQSQ